MIALTLRAILTHWRRHPIQAVTLFVGLALATALWTGVQAINVEARASYDAASETAQAGQLAALVAGSGPATRADYVALRRAGWRVSPVIDGTLSGRTGPVPIMGIDPLSFPVPGLATDPGNPASLMRFLRGETVLATAETAAALADSGLPDITITPGAGAAILMDIALAARILDQPDTLSRIVIAPGQSDSLPALSALAPHLAHALPDQQNDIDGLTESFHLNLTAFGFLAFGVGLFIVHGAIGLAFEQRRPVIRTLRALGVPLRTIIAALCAELLVLALVASAIGVIAGYGIAAALLPDVASTLRGLYGAEVPGALSIRPEWWLAGIGIGILGTALAALHAIRGLIQLPLLATAKPRALSRLAGRSLRIQAGAALVLLLGAGVLALVGQGLIAGFAVMGGLLIGAALLLPLILILCLALGARTARGPIAQWFWADTTQQIPGLSLALMALLLALATNIGVGTMVSSFRLTFTGWLDQRLSSELYVSGRTGSEATAIAAFLDDRVDAVLPIWFANADFAGQKGRVYGVVDHPTYVENWPVMQQEGAAWRAVHDGGGVLLSEQTARRAGLATGDHVALAPGLRLPLVGTYADYGNPMGQAIIALSTLETHFPEIAKRRFGLRVDPARIDDLRRALMAEFDLPTDAVINQSALKSFSLHIFERTFAVTAALNILTLAVAGFAILMSLLTLSTMRLPQVAPVWALGMTRRRLAALDMLRSLLLAALTLLVAIPLGLMLAWVLLAIVNVEAFGWRLPMYLFPGHWFVLVVLGLAAALLASALPVLRLARTPPDRLLRVFSHGR